jgi:hypothetical protein
MAIRPGLEVSSAARVTPGDSAPSNNRLVNASNRNDDVNLRIDIAVSNKR